MTPSFGIPGEKFEVIELLRFLAAASVVLFHMEVPYFTSWGVDVFFVISGFVMMASTAKDGAGFLRKRLIRIVPLYWLCTGLVFAVALVAPSVLGNTTADPVDLLRSLLFIPFDKNGMGHFPVLFLGWTLNFEMLFYGLFAAALLVTHNNRGLVTAALVISVYALSQSIETYPVVAYRDVRVLEFVLGVAIYDVLRSRSPGRLALYMGLYLLPVLVGWERWTSHHLWIGLPSGLLVAWLIVASRGVRFPNIILLLGGSSYALYLTHYYVIKVCDVIFDAFGPGRTASASWKLAVLLLCCAVAVLTFVAFEKPVTKRLREMSLRICFPPASSSTATRPVPSSHR